MSTGDDENQRLLHELRVHQVELEVQNRELREAHASLEESRNRYADLYDFAPIAYYTFDVRGCIQDVNLTGATLIGRDRTRLIGLPFLAFVNLDDPSLFWAHLKRCSEERRPVVSELRILSADGAPQRDVQAVSAPVLDATGGVIAFRTSFTDITDRKRAEEANLRLASIVASSDDAIIGKSLEGLITSWNRAAERMFGYTEEEAVGRPMTLLIPPDRIEEEAEILHTLARNERSDHLETVRRRKDGNDLAVSVTISPMRNGAGQVIGASSITRDISARREAEADRDRALASEQGLRRQLQVLDRAIIMVTQELARVSRSSMNDVLQVIVDQARILVGAEYGAFGTASGFEQTFDPWVFSGIDAKGAALIGRFPKEIGLLGAVIREGRTTRVSDLRQHPAFSGFPPHHPLMTSFLGLPVRYGERILGHLYLTNKQGADAFTAEDQQSVEMLATRVAIAMEIARLSDATHEAIHARDDLLAIVSHDLRSPLTAIALSSTVLLSDDGPGERRSSRKQLEVIKRSAEHMGRLIDDLLQAANIEAGRFTIDPRVEAPRPIIDECFEMLEPTGVPKDIRFERDMPPSLTAVLCDRPRVIQVFSNLVGNAIKFTPEHGVIRISAKQEGSEVCFAVSDNGCGVPEDALPHLFERYWKAGAESGRGPASGCSSPRASSKHTGGGCGSRVGPGRGAPSSSPCPSPLRSHSMRPARNPSARLRLVVALVAIAGCDPQLAMSSKEGPRVTIEGCQAAVAHLRTCCPAYDSYLSCTYASGGAAFLNTDLSSDQSRCLAGKRCDQLEKAITGDHSLCGVTFRSQRCR